MSDATTTAPHLRRAGTTDTRRMDRVIALSPVAVGLIWYATSGLVRTGLVTLAVTLGLRCLLNLTRRRPPAEELWSTLRTALLLIFLLPAALAPGWAAAAAAAAVLLGPGLWGTDSGWVLHPVLLVRLLLDLSASGTAAGPAAADLPVILILPGALYLYLRRVSDMTGPVLLLLAASLPVWVSAGDLPLTGSPFAYLNDMTLLLTVWFIAADPVGLAAARTMRLAQLTAAGLLIGITHLSGGGNTGLWAVTLLTQAFTPLLDRLSLTRVPLGRTARSSSRRVQP